MEFKFFIPGKPVGKGRPRFTTFKGRAIAYTPKTTKEAEKLCRDAFLDLYENCEPLRTPVQISIHAVFRVPSDFSKAKKQLVYDRKIVPSKKPDLDNIVKLVLDAMNGLAFTDDANVVSISALKRFVRNPEEEQGIKVWIREIEL